MTFERQIITTADGSHTLTVKGIDETYHSTNGAVTESKHVFIESGLNLLNLHEISILEVGFGTGLNALLTLSETLQKSIRIDYIGVEKYPLTNDEIEQLNYSKIIGHDLSDAFQRIHQAKWGQFVDITSQFRILKIKSDFRDVGLSSFDRFNLVYFDAFAPNKQPDLWNKEVYEKIFERCQPGAVFVTYCAKGSVRRDLMSAGFSVEKIPGPPGKREMIRAVK
ncbi:MAG: tRNA (5-methylaminomethyl-2-thiouridine)(34)-methyltransferase MnmD [Prolixibacteraceae bacterium]|nr:tRNA (5-methylaminomethyl-2-thiouridine)(34)-methyltransferase MnmD [Prolixibacteraceae bacterium]